MPSPRTLLALGVAGGAIAFASSASAAGFYLQEQSARGAGRAYSGEVADTGTASLWWNPAAITGIRHGEVSGSVSGIFIDSQVDDDGSTITRPGQPTRPIGGDPTADDPILTGYLPAMAGAWRLNEKVVLGLSVSSPYSFTSNYEWDSWTRYDALKSRLLTIDVQGTAAVAVTDWLDIGAGLSLQYSDATLTSALPNLSPLLPDGRQVLTGDGWDAGWTVGFQARPNDRWSIGGSYRSKVEHTLDGHVSITGLLGPAAAGNREVDGAAAFTTPWMAILGARWRVTDELTLNGQIQRIGWGEFESIDVMLPGVTQVTEQNYEDVTTAAVGFDYQWRPDWTFRGGIQYDPTPTPDIGRSARVPDGDRWLFAAGASKTFGDSLIVDAGISYISFDESRIRRDDVVFAGTPLQTPVALNGTVEGSAVVVSTGVRWTF